LALPNLEVPGKKNKQQTSFFFFYKRHFNHGIQTVGDLRFDLNNIDSYELVPKHVQKPTFLEWTGLRHSVPLNLTNANHNPDYAALNPSFKIDCGLFDVIN